LAVAPDGAAVGETRVAHHDVEPAEGGGGLLDQAARGVGPGEIALDDQRLAAGIAHGLGDLVGARTVLAGVKRDGGVGSGERASGGGADARRGTGDQDGTGHVGSGW
jgi:hypothetical protein